MDKNIYKSIIVNFDNLKETRLKIKKTFNEIDIIKNSIKQNYIQYIEKENKNFFGLDSFHFQNKAIELEYENMLHLYHFIDNRIYGDYYKLFSMLHKSLQEQLSDSQLYKIKELEHLNKYPMYKDLQPFKIYEFDLINQIHQDIILVLANINELIRENMLNIDSHKKQLELGMNIDNYVINQKYKNNYLKLNNNLYENYLQVFHNYHDSWLKKYNEKIELFYKQISHHKENVNKENVKDENIIIDTNDNIMIEEPQEEEPQEEKEETEEPQEEKEEKEEKEETEEETEEEEEPQEEKEETEEEEEKEETEEEEETQEEEKEESSEQSTEEI